MARGSGGFRPLNNGGGRGGNNNDRRRSRSPPDNKNSNTNNNTTAGGPSAPQNTASAATAPAPSFTFEMRRLVAAAFQRFPAELAAASVVKDAVLPDVFTATDAAAYYDPAQGGSREATLAALQQRLADLMKSKDIADWMMEKAVTFIDPQPKAIVVKNNNKNRFEQQQQQQQQQQNNHYNNKNHQDGAVAVAVVPPPPPYNSNNNIDFQQQQQQQQQGFGFNNRFMNNKFQQQPLALLPDPSDPKIIVVKNLPDDINNEQNVRITINNRANNSIVKTVLCEHDKKHAVVFCFDDTQALALRLFPPGTVFLRAPDARIVECDAATWKHALTVLRDRVVAKEELAMAEINQITCEEEGLTMEEVLKKLGKSAAAAKPDEAVAASSEPVVSAEEIAARRIVDELTAQRNEILTGLEKYKKELAVLESFGAAIAALASQNERKTVVENEVKNRSASLAEMENHLQHAQATLEKFTNKNKSTGADDNDENNNSNHEQQNNGGETEGNNNNITGADGKRAKQISTSSGQIGNPKALLFFSGFSSEGNNLFNAYEVNEETGVSEDKGWSNAKILTLLKHLPNIQPLHVWRSPKNTDVCVEVAGGPAAVANAANFLSFNDYVFCGIRVTRTRPQPQLLL